MSFQDVLPIVGCLPTIVYNIEQWCSGLLTGFRNGSTISRVDATGTGAPEAVARKGPAAESAEFNKATVRILRVLSAFSQPQQSFGVSELNRSLGLSKNLVFRALATLVAEGYVMRMPAAHGICLATVYLNSAPASISPLIFARFVRHFCGVFTN